MAIGPNVVTNLMGMMVITRLSRVLVENYWIPEVLGEELGTPFLTTFVDLEEDIWSIADDVLTPQQQNDLRALVDEWHAENPDQVYPWYVSLSDFSGQRSATLAAVQHSGGLLSEVARAREAAEEIQAFGERILYYLQRAPMITSNEFESGVSDMLKNPEIARLLDDTDRLVTSIETLAQAVGELPDERIVAIDQLMDRVRAEREAVLSDVAEAQPELRAFLADLLPVLELLERTMVASKDTDSDSRPFDVNEYRALVAESAVTATELRMLIESISDLLGEGNDAAPIVNKLLAAEQAAARQAFWYSVALILIFFVTLFIYRLSQRRFLAN